MQLGKGIKNHFCLYNRQQTFFSPEDSLRNLKIPSEQRLSVKHLGATKSVRDKMLLTYKNIYIH